MGGFFFFCAVQVCEERVKKTWSVVDAESHQKDDVKRDTVYCLNDDDETEVQKDDTIQGESLFGFFFLSVRQIIKHYSEAAL